MSWSGFKKNVGRATTQVMMKTGHVDRTTDREYEVEERRYRTLEASATRLQKEARGYLDSLRAMTASQMRIAETIDAFYGESGARDGVSRSYKQAVEDLDAETIKALDGPYRFVPQDLERDWLVDDDYGLLDEDEKIQIEWEMNFGGKLRKRRRQGAGKISEEERLEGSMLMDTICRQTVLEPINRFCAYFPDINECIKKRNHKMLDYDAMRSKVKKLTEKPDKDPAKLPRTEKETEMVGRYSLSQSSDSSTVCRISNEINFPSPTRVLDSPHRRAKERATLMTLSSEGTQLRKVPNAFNKQRTSFGAIQSPGSTTTTGSGEMSRLVGNETFEVEEEDDHEGERQTVDPRTPVSRISSVKTIVCKSLQQEADKEEALLKRSQSASNSLASNKTLKLSLCDSQKAMPLRWFENKRNDAITIASTGSPEKRMSIWTRFTPVSPAADEAESQMLRHRRISELKENTAHTQFNPSQPHRRALSGSSINSSRLGLDVDSDFTRSQNSTGTYCSGDEDQSSPLFSQLFNNPHLPCTFPVKPIKSHLNHLNRSIPSLMGPHNTPISTAKISSEQQARSSTSSPHSPTSSRTPAPSFMNPSDLEELLEPLKESYITYHADLCKQAKAAYEQLNEQLTSEIPQLIDLRVPYLDPTFEALVKIQLRFCAEAYSRMAQVQQYLDASTRDQYASGELDQRVEDVLGQIRELSIAGTV